MEVFLIGLGGAGCRVAYQFFKANKSNVYGVLIDTDMADLSYLKHRYRIPLGEGMLNGEGTQKDLELGMEVIQAEKYSLVEKITRVKEDVDCFFVIASAGGGTGGACGVLIEELKKNFIEPVYYIGLLPSKEDLPAITLNAGKGLKEAVKHCDAFFPIDLDRLNRYTRLKGNYHLLNNRIVRMFENLFQIGEFSGRRDIGENTVDFQDLAKTLTGFSVLGMEEYNFKEDFNVDKPETVIEITNRALNSTTLPIDLKDVKKALVIVLGDRDHIDFLGSIPARLWVEKSIGGKEVRGGDMPLEKKGGVEVLVVLSDVNRSESMATFYRKVGVLSKSHSLDENLSEIVDRLGLMKQKISDLEEEMNHIYKKLKVVVNKRAPEK